MSEKRRDNKGRVLQKGESQRKDNRYQFRYTDNMGKRRTIYSSDLNDLRKRKKFANLLKTALIMLKEISRFWNW